MYAPRSTKFAAVIFALAFKKVLRLLQRSFGRKVAASNTPLYQRLLKPSDAERGNTSELESRLPWSGFGSDTTFLSDASIRLEEQPTQGMNNFELRPRHS